MELRALRYLRAVAQEGSVSNAAKALHVTQPTLSRQLAALEEELGCALFTRSYKGFSLNDKGAMLLRYAESILELADKAKDELAPRCVSVRGPVYIGAGETMNMVYVARAMERVRAQYPEVSFELYSGSTVDLADGFARGAYDFLIECEAEAHVDCNTLELPLRDRWGVLALRRSRFGALARVEPEDLLGESLMLSRQARANGIIARWAGDLYEDYDLCTAYNLPLNPSIMVRTGVGVQLIYEGLFEASADSELVFVPLSPELTSRQGLVWRKMALSRQAAAFLGELRAVIDGRE